jgi:hypothetical protein
MYIYFYYYIKSPMMNKKEYRPGDAAGGTREAPTEGTRFITRAHATIDPHTTKHPLSPLFSSCLGVLCAQLRN